MKYKVLAITAITILAIGAVGLVVATRDIAGGEMSMSPNDHTESTTTTPSMTTTTSEGIRCDDAHLLPEEEAMDCIRELRDDALSGTFCQTYPEGCGLTTTTSTTESVPTTTTTMQGATQSALDAPESDVETTTTTRRSYNAMYGCDPGLGHELGDIHHDYRMILWECGHFYGWTQKDTIRTGGDTLYWGIDEWDDLIRYFAALKNYQLLTGANVWDAHTTFKANDRLLPEFQSDYGDLVFGRKAAELSISTLSDAYSFLHGFALIHDWDLIAAQQVAARHTATLDGEPETRKAVSLVRYFLELKLIEPQTDGLLGAEALYQSRGESVKECLASNREFIAKWLARFDRNWDVSPFVSPHRCYALHWHQSWQR